jgi:hypothetical protein
MSLGRRRAVRERGDVIGIAQCDGAATESVRPNAVRSYAACHNVCQNNQHSRYWNGPPSASTEPLKCLIFALYSPIIGVSIGAGRAEPGIVDYGCELGN